MGLLQTWPTLIRLNHHFYHFARGQDCRCYQEAAVLDAGGASPAR